MGLEVGFTRPFSDEMALLSKLKAAAAMKDCLTSLADQAASEEFHRATALIRSAIAAVDDELDHQTRMKIRSERQSGISG